MAHKNLHAKCFKRETTLKSGYECQLDQLSSALERFTGSDSNACVVIKIVSVVLVKILRILTMLVRNVSRMTMKKFYILLFVLFTITTGAIYYATASDVYPGWAYYDDEWDVATTTETTKTIKLSPFVQWRPTQETTNAMNYSSYFPKAWRHHDRSFEFSSEYWKVKTPKSDNVQKLDTTYLIRAYQNYHTRDIEGKPRKVFIDEKKAFYNPMDGKRTMRILLSDMDIPRFINKTSEHAELPPPVFFTKSCIFLVLVLAILILCTILGNVFVIVAILIEKNLQTVPNYLIVSLAVADLMVACMVMPLGALYEVYEGWILGPQLCEIWTASDVLCCTSSILHLVAIALDRYWSVTDIEYITKRNSCRVLSMIALIWSISLFVSITPQFGFKDPGYLDRINVHKQCMVSQNVGYQVFATFSTFYIPLVAILVLYWKIYQAARVRIHKYALRSGGLPTTSTAIPEESIAVAGTVVISNTRPGRSIVTIFCCGCKQLDTIETSTGIPLTELQSSGSGLNSCQEKFELTEEELVELRRLQRKKRLGTAALIIGQLRKMAVKRRTVNTLEARREKKAAQTLAVITGVFVVCWLPFFVMALYMSIFPEHRVHPYFVSFFLWLGYFNSTLNPIIYTVFNPEFRKAFLRIITCMSSRNSRRRAAMF